MNFFKRFLFVFAVAILASLPLAAKKASKNAGIQTLINFENLENKIFSWNGNFADVLVSKWGIPTKQYQMSNGDYQYEYIAKDFTTTSESSSYSTSYYSEFLNTAYSSGNTTITTTTKEKNSRIAIIVSNNKIVSINYSGYYDQLNLLSPCAAPDFAISEERAARLKFLSSLLDKTWEKMTIDEIFELEKFSSDYGKLNKMGKEAIYNASLDVFKKKSKGSLKKIISFQEGRLSKDNKAIELYIIYIIIYGDLYNVEKFKGYKDRFINSKNQ